MINSNEIPIITDPRGKHWDQPNKDQIVIDDNHAAMTEATLLKLKNYSASIPSGVYDGKMWRAESKGVNYLRWYGPSSDPNKCKFYTRIILIIN